MMRLAFSTISCPDDTVEQIAAAARAYGYDGVELYALAGRRLTPDLLQAQLAPVRRAFQTAGLPVVCLNSWAHLACADSAELAAQEAQIACALDLAAALGCPLVKAFGGELPPGLPATEVYDTMAGALLRVCPRAASLGVRLVVETHDAFSRGAVLAELLRRVAHPAFAALWDVHHPYRLGEAVEDTNHLIGARVAHVHVKDAVREGDGWRFVLLGEGELPVARQIGLLARRGYDGYLSVDWEKMWHPEIAGPEVALPQYAATLRQYIARGARGSGVGASP